MKSRHHLTHWGREKWMSFCMILHTELQGQRQSICHIVISKYTDFMKRRNTIKHLQAFVHNSNQWILGTHSQIALSIVSQYSQVTLSRGPKFHEFHTALYWLKNYTNQIRMLSYKRYPISRPYGRAMGCVLWGFLRKLTALQWHCTMLCSRWANFFHYIMISQSFKIVKI